MALQKVKKLASGIEASYFKIIDIKIDLVNMFSTVRLALYVSKQARQDGYEPIEHNNYFWQGEDSPFSLVLMDTANPVALAYEKIKAFDPFFADALDV